MGQKSATIPPPTIWNRILDAAATEYARVYSASFFTRHDVSIVDQQLRALKLCYALSQASRPKITSSSHIGIIGAGFGGLTCAVALSMRHNCIVSLFDRDDELLRKFREGSFRYISPNLNSRVELDPYDGDDHSESTNFPLLNWSANYAPLVAQEVIQKFNHYRRYSGISLHLGEEVTSVKLGCRGRPALHVLTGFGLGTVSRTLQVDIAILASGFGAEKSAEKTNDTSYWRSGNPEFYRPIKKRRARKERVLISGNGDSAVIELAHYLIKDFKHSDLRYLMPGKLGDGGNFTSPISSHHLPYRVILDEFHPAAISTPGPIVWYFQTRNGKRFGNLHPRLKLRSRIAQAYGKLIYGSIDTHLHSYEPGDVISPELLESIDGAIAPAIREMASLDIEFLMSKLSYSAITTSSVRPHELKRHMQDRIRIEFELTIEGLTPTIYSPRQAPQSWFLLRLFQILGAARFTYRPVSKARLSDTAISLMQSANRWHDDEHKPRRFDRVVVRRGPDFSPYRDLATQKCYRPGYVLMDDTVLWWRWATETSGYYEDALNKFFRTKRWQSIVRKSERIEDRSRGRDTSDKLDLRLVDRLFLRAWTEGNLALARKSYRSIKRMHHQKKDEAVLVKRLTALGKNVWDQES